MPGGSTSTATTEDTRTVRNDERPRYARRPGRIKLRVLDGPDKGSEQVIDRTRVRVGRSRSADVRLEHPSLSGLHFELKLNRQGVELMDLGSKNGTTLLGRRTFHTHVHPGDVILAGDCRIELVEVGDIEVEYRAEAHEDGLLGVSGVMREAFAILGKIAPRDMPVLVTGETGTGKELFARALHRRSRRSGGPLIVLDCGALAPTLAEAALFGHCRGAFTGADEDRPGVFEHANGGTLFIDELGELPLELQVKLLRALDRQEVTRIGEGVPRRFDVRVISATHRDLRMMVDEGEFREDLYFRLAHVSIELPTLRERGPEDILHLARSFLNEIIERDGISVTLGSDAISALTKHRWPGNVRELRVVIERAAALCEGPAIRKKDLVLNRHAPRITLLDELLRYGSLKATHNEVDRIIIARALEETGGNISKAARRLDVGRKALTNRAQELGLYPTRT